jgi:hypothetical protein
VVIWYETYCVGVPAFSFCGLPTTVSRRPSLKSAAIASLRIVLGSRIEMRRSSSSFSLSLIWSYSDMSSGSSSGSSCRPSNVERVLVVNGELGGVTSVQPLPLAPSPWLGSSFPSIGGARHLICSYMAWKSSALRWRRLLLSVIVVT